MGKIKNNFEKHTNHTLLVKRSKDVRRPEPFANVFKKWAESLEEISVTASIKIKRTKSVGTTQDHIYA